MNMCAVAGFAFSIGTWRTDAGGSRWASSSGRAFTALESVMTEIQAGLPGEDLITQGLRDLEQGVETIEALLVSMSAPRLRAIGLVVPTPFADPELRLYHRLAARYGAAAHGRYNALVRRIVSYQRAAACAR